MATRKLSMRAIVILFCSCGIVSCNKYLEKKSDSTLVVPSTIEDLQKLLDDNAIMNLATPSFGETSADDYFLVQSVFDSRPVEQQNKYLWKKQDYSFPNDWSYGYQAIYNANLCLEKIEEIKNDASNTSSWNNVKGGALFFRAYYFMQLCWIYSKAYDERTFENDNGIALRLSSDFNIPSVRSSVKSCYAQIIKDLKESIAYLPDNPVHVMRPSKAAAYGALARTYLSMRKYDSSYKYADLCLKLKSELLDYNSLSVTEDSPFPPFNKEIIFYTEMNVYNTLHSPGRGSIDTILYLSYDDNDLRKQAYFRPRRGYQMFKGSYSGDPSILFTGIATDEMLLSRAECLARLGNIKNALNDLNTLLRMRWKNDAPYIDISTDNQDLAIEIMLNERRKEILMRGLRWMDVKRLNKDKGNIILTRIVGTNSFVLLPNDNYYALPLPLDIIEATNMPQN